MDMIKVLDFEKEIVKKYIDEEQFIEFMKENGSKKLDLDFSNLKLKELSEDDVENLGEETVLDYLEEVATITFEDEAEDEEAKVVRNLPGIASLAFHYLREGVAYLDIVQEGTLGLIKALENYRDEDGDFDNYKNYWIIREMVLFINGKISDIKNEFRSYFRDKKEHFGHDHEHEEGHDEETGEVFLTEKDLLPSVEAIEKREKLVDRIIEFSYLKNRLSDRQIEVLNLYFGFGVDRRYSIFEIEEKLKLQSGDGEKIFEQSLFILSTVEGKVFL
ncbi:RNA polymerase sigma factor RpoS [Fusobacterium sp. DD29]|uniref:sigma factor n=1 Tax=unclassified Fusobacterium TaxID=2648384 RepID=UPI001B8B83DA|nr:MULTISPECIES: sigma factor [unclassified Fusobacterium]MBR8701958.1 RNA polymerase sigma factor RpoS [Fusobacterium sp. DD45]MBR8711759.1 RNA polymerase sigma factor RpoS [Fusobacterium sp. DD28]MBR8750154.1 RNA polymerase sigma factor RpoS [Fusobacterium sp. DD29]MBR8752314.1 RNA polymerase sigma factor RpoS [Fusobacterium sp. DD26]MBR8762389.1 RNA polymerase sigma factor RpoS [Fusobacterium sp. DD25]